MTGRYANGPKVNCGRCHVVLGHWTDEDFPIPTKLARAQPGWTGPHDDGPQIRILVLVCRKCSTEHTFVEPPHDAGGAPFNPRFGYRLGHGGWFEDHPRV